MARIIYKQGLEGQNHLECIEGIEIELLNGQKALIYPKYKELPLLDREKIVKWKMEKFAGFKALKVVNAKELTDELYKLGSPAAEFVRQFASEKGGEFDLPTLLAAGEIVEQKNDIDALAETIEGADLLSVAYDVLWSCCRNSFLNVWSVDGNFGFISSDYICSELTVVPISLYR